MSDTWDSAPLAPAQSAPSSSAWDTAPVVGSTVKQKAVAFSNDNGDEAAKAIKLGKQMQLPPSVVQSDVPGYDATARQQAASKAVDNPALAKYVENNPLAAQVSGDDWAAMQEASETLQALHPELVRRKAQGGVFAGIAEVGQLMQDAPGRDKLFSALKQLPEAFLTSLNTGIMDMLKTPGKVASGEINLNTPQGLEQGISFGVGVALGSRDIRFGRTDGIKPSAGQSSPADVESFLGTLKGMASRAEIDAFLKSKEQGPPGAMLMIEHAREGSEALSKAVEVAQESKTKQRSPELFAEAADAHEAGSVHIDAAKMLELYQKEGKVPAEGDGLFGFVPDVAGKIQDAAATGGEVSIPVGQYIAHIDPAVHEGLKDNVRLHEDGVTPAEAKEAEKAIEAWHGTPHDFESFDLSKIGTGEGAQSYGHGLYFAENREVSASYKTAGTNQLGVSVEVDGKFPVIDIDGNAVKIFDTEKEAKDFVKAQGNLYKVAINADPQKFLDWDKPINEQPEIMQKLIEAFPEAAADLLPNEAAATFNTGQDVYGAIKDLLRDPTLKTALDKNGFYRFDDGREAASKALAEAGIPGIKYLDQGSRGVGDGTRNYVVFDDKLVKITEKNGNPIEAAVIEAVEAETKQMKLSPNLTMYFDKGKAVGITEGELAQYSKKIERQEQAVLDSAVRLKEAAIRKPLTAEWKRNEAATRAEVVQELTSQGPYATEEYFRANKIKFEGETARANADQVAPLFGFETGADMLAQVAMLEADRIATGQGPKMQREAAIKAETAARMEERYGDLKENIAKEARQLALDTHTFDILADEVRLLAKAAGVEPPLTRTELVEWAKQSFERSVLPEASNWTKLSRAVERGGRETEKALLKGDFQEAFQAKQRQMLAAQLAKESLALQKVLDQVEGKIDRFLSEATIKGLDQIYLEQIRQMLASVGLSQQFHPSGDLGSLRDFVDASEGQLAIAPWLMDGSQPKMQDMSVAQFRTFADSLKSLEHVGRKAGLLENARGQAELQNVVGDVVKALQRFPFIDQPSNPSIPQRIQSSGRKILGAHLLVERVLDYTDQFNPHGPLTEWLDRPLRDANSKEITMTEGVVRQLRELKQFTDDSINDLIPNRLIPDALAKLGFAQMTRQNLRVLMLNMGNWSNLKKLAEGMKISEMDLRRFVDAEASPKDVAWVNGIWKVFEDLKPLADEVQTRDTGVPADHIPAVPWEIAKGKLNGGYYPLSYDPYNSDINGRIASPLFDKGYFAATTPHGYTRERTGYTGAIDLSGDFLSSKIQGMVHDIAFREAVRNGEKLIKNQEFRTAVAQHWGKEVADLLPGWLRDIANSHNLDDTYAKDMVRAASLIRQNVTSTLIAYNPGTFIKHGFTAAVMSANEVGGAALLSATYDVGLKGAAKSLKELASRADHVPDEAFMEAFRGLVQQGERGENARQFVMGSSAVMRNRQRQYDESIRGAVDAITEIGLAKTLADFRQRQMLYGRLAVAFSDQMSAMPTWLAAYQKAFMEGESHADAVFIADKKMSRAHGSSFIGDKPLVSRTGNTPTGELARWFTSLYNFWNHQFNNQVQLTWDIAAMVRGAGEPPPMPPGAPPRLKGQGMGPEPGANARSVSARIAGIMAIILIEEMATAAKDEDHHGLLAKVALASLRYLGGGFVGAREITNGLAGGYEPSTGMVGTLWKAGSDTAKDIAKATGAKAGAVKNTIIHTATTLGFLTGVGGSQLGRTAQFGADVVAGRDRPQTFNDYRQGLRTGHSKARKH